MVNIIGSLVNIAGIYIIGLLTTTDLRPYQVDSPSLESFRLPLYLYVQPNYRYEGIFIAPAALRDRENCL
jgi:hypothetical protein